MGKSISKYSVFSTVKKIIPECMSGGESNFGKIFGGALQRVGITYG
tara:strand:+ start:647 stop:784 length:138 start_codon:yes stop_codon:yes gene_type:complete